jgi:hypothetical protein
VLTKSDINNFSSTTSGLGTTFRSQGKTGYL